jgi:hypothetical protein
MFALLLLLLACCASLSSAVPSLRAPQRFVPKPFMPLLSSTASNKKSWRERSDLAADNLLIDFPKPMYGSVPVGTVALFAGSESTLLEPSGWMFCSGQTLSVSQYPELFAAIGTSYGGSEHTLQVPLIASPDIAKRMHYMIRFTAQPAAHFFGPGMTAAADE